MPSARGFSTLVRIPVACRISFSGPPSVVIASFVSNNNFFQPQAAPCNTASSSLDELGNTPAWFLVALLAIASHVPELLLSLLASQVPKVLSDDYLLPFYDFSFHYCYGKSQIRVHLQRFRQLGLPRWFEISLIFSGVEVKLLWRCNLERLLPTLHSLLQIRLLLNNNFNKTSHPHHHLPPSNYHSKHIHMQLTVNCKQTDVIAINQNLDRTQFCVQV